MSLFDLETRAKPVLKWAGGKSGPLPQLVQKFPSSCRRYIEPFFGGGAVFFSLREGTPAVLGDVNEELINVYETVRDDLDALTRQLDRYARRYCEEFYYHLRKQRPRNRVQRAARTLFLNKTGYNGLYRLNSRGGFNVPFGKRVRCPALYVRENLEQVRSRLVHAKFVCGDFAEVIGQAGPGDFVYCDPPYEPISRTSSFRSYTALGFTQEDQRRLKKACEAAVQRGATVAVSNSSARFITRLYADWARVRVLAKRPINSKGARRGAVKELLAYSGYVPF